MPGARAASRLAARFSAGVVVVTLTGCPEPDLRLRALPGCGRDLSLTSLRVVVRGDFAPTPRVSGETLTLPPLPRDAAAITVEGLVGDNLVEAVGRTRSLEPAAGGRDLPVYFAPEDSLCAVPTQVEWRAPAGAAVSAQGQIVVVSGRTADDSLTAQILAGSDLEETLAPVGELPVPSVGAAVVADVDGVFWVIGGAGPSGALSSMVSVDLSQVPDDPVSEPILLNVDGKIAPRAHAALARLSPEEALVIGGCRGTDPEGRCVPGPETVLGTTLGVDLTTRPIGLASAPALSTPRFDHHALVASDGVVFVVGGVGATGEAVHAVERRRLDGAWQSFGPDLSAALGEDLAAAGVFVAGATLLEPGRIVVALTDGRVVWMTQDEAGVVDELVGTEVEVAAPRRTMLTLPGERVLLDDFVLPLFLPGANLAEDQGPGTDASQVVSLTEVVPGPRRAGAHALSLSDGTVAMLGGWSLSGEPASGAFLLRLRPPLDGPDERLPPVSSPSEAAVLAHGPGISLEADALVLDGVDASDDDSRFPVTGFHARGTRGAALRFDATLDERSGSVLLGLWRGAVAATTVELAAPATLHHRRADAAVTTVTCDGPGVLAAGEVALRVRVEDGEVELSVGGEVVARCQDPAGTQPAAVGLSVAAGGRVRARQLRLARL